MWLPTTNIPSLSKDHSTEQLRLAADTKTSTPLTKVTVAARQMCASLRIYNVSSGVALYVALTLHYVALKSPQFLLQQKVKSVPAAPTGAAAS